MPKRSMFAVLVGMALVALLALSGVALASGPFAVTKTVPSGGATGIARAANISAYFNHDIRGSTVTSTTFKVRKQNTTTWLGATRSVNNTISPTSANGGSQSVATLNPNADLAAGTTYQVMVVGGSSGVKDVNGRALGANKSWTFTTAAAPETTIGAGPVGTVASTSATFTLSSSKAGSTFQCKIDSQTFAGCTSPKSYSGLSQGPHTFQVKAIDASGTQDSTAASRSWTVDTVGPDASITEGPPNPSDSRSATFAFNGAEGSGGYQCKIDGAGSTGTFSSCTSGQSFTVDADGAYTFSVQASDSLGNFGTADSHSWTVDTSVDPPVDTIAPTVDNLSPADRTTGVAASTNVTATFSEEMNPFSISGQTFKLFVAGSLVSAQVSYDQNSRTATLDPAQDLEAGATYDAKITKDVHLNGQNIDGVKDLAGNTINGDKTWSFTVEAPSGVVTAAPKTLNLSPDIWCFPRQEFLTVTNRTPVPVTFAAVSITGPDAANFSDGASGYILNNGPFTVLSENHVFDQVTFNPGPTATDRHRAYQATLAYKDSTGATIGNPVELRATTACITVGL